MESIPLKVSNFGNVIEFIDQFIITRFSLPFTLMFYNASYSLGNAMTKFAPKRCFKLKYYANYYPQGKCLIQIYKQKSHKDY